MPENAAAEGGFGLGANEAFGGQVGTGSLGGSEVGGAQGSFGGFGGEGPGSPAAQAAAASNAVAAAEAVFSSAGVQNGILGMMGLAPGMDPNAPAQSMAPSMSAPAVAAGFNPEAVFGMTAPSMNPSTGGLLAGSPAPGTAPTVDQSAYAAPDLPEPSVVSPMAPAQVSAPSISISAPSMSALSDQSFNPEAVFGMMAPSMNPSTMGLLAGNPTPDMAPVADTAPAINADPIASYGTGTSAMSVDPAAIGGNLAGILGTPAAPAPAAPAMSPSTIAQDMVAMSTSPAPAPAMVSSPAMAPSMTSRPQARPEDDRSFLGRMIDGIQMGLSVNPFASREAQTQSLIDRGWDTTDVSRHMAASINTDRANQAMVENQIGGRDFPFIPDSELTSFANNLPQDEFRRFMMLDRDGQMQAYRQARGY